MPNPRSFTVTTQRALERIDLLKQLRDADFPVDVSFFDRPPIFHNAERTRTFGFVSELRICPYGSPDAQRASKNDNLRHADLYDVVPLALAHPEFFRDRNHLPLLILGEPFQFTKMGRVLIPVFPHHVTGIATLTAEPLDDAWREPKVLVAKI